ncbi:MAG: putative short-subunit dehydrogenase-like oxidoreductase (DUF2520 family) [Polaribacter sp.]|jgi:predicted short-subunit dehydrogenase-like oxidoreductase (DUF2520 family)
MQSTTIIGAGNLAHHLGKQLVQQAVAVHQVFSRKKRKAQQLAKLLSAKATNKINEIEDNADLYIIAVSDNAIASVAEQLAQCIDAQKSLVVHTSGATPSTVLKKHFKHYGVFYPLQSFSKDKTVNFQNIPICIDAKYVRDRKALTKLGESISNKVFTINDKERASLHVAAVFVNNFTNLLYQRAAKILDNKDLPFDLLRPLLLETALKVQQYEPKDMQTGPAIRGDQKTIDRHLSYLEKEHPDYYDLYSQLTKQLLPE